MSERTCPRCGSTTVVDDVRLFSYQANAEHEVGAFLCRRPNALLAKGESLHRMHARVCGGCGLTELYVERADQLLDAARERDGGRRS